MHAIISVIYIYIVFKVLYILYYQRYTFVNCVSFQDLCDVIRVEKF